MTRIEPTPPEILPSGATRAPRKERERAQRRKDQKRQREKDDARKDLPQGDAERDESEPGSTIDVRV